MKPTASPANFDTPYRLPSRHPSAGRGDRPSSSDEASDAPSGAADAVRHSSDIKRRQEAILLSYLIHRPGRY